MTREKLSKTLDYWREGLISKSKVLELIWGQPFDGETEKITKKDAEEDLETTKRRLELTHNAIRVATEQFDRVNWGWEGDCGSKNIMRTLEEFLPILVEINTTKSASSTSPATEESSVAATIGNEADFVTKTMTADEIVAAKMARDLHQIRKQIYALGKYQTNLLGGGGWDTLFRMCFDAERLDSHLRRRWNTPTPNPHNQ